MKRLFLALPLSEEAALQLWQSWEPFRSSSRHIRWIKPEQFHLTLVFLGDTEESVIPDIVDVMEKTGKDYPPIPIVTGGPGHFPLRGSPRVLFESLQEGRSVTAKLQKHLSRGLSGLAEPEGRKFHPHITMARIRKKGFIPSGYLPCLQTNPVEDRFEEIVLYESLLFPSGPEYHTLHRTALRK